VEELEIGGNPWSAEREKLVEASWPLSLANRKLRWSSD
jgi:hypothetical protein